MSEGRGLLRNLSGGTRLAVLRRVQPADLAVTPEAFALLAFANLAVVFALSFAGVGWNGEFNVHELPRALLPVLLLLALGVVVARDGGGRADLLLLPVALMAAGTVITAASGLAGLLVQYEAVPLPVKYWPYLDYLTTLWWALAISATVVRLAPCARRVRARNVTVALLLLAVPVWLVPQGYLWAPRRDADAEVARRWSPGGIGEEAFYAQQDALERMLAGLEPERPGIPDLYLIAAGMDAREDVFMKEVKLIETLFRSRFDAQGRTLALINNPGAVYDYPLASLTSLAAALRHVGSLMNPEEDVLVLYLSSHGSDDHRLAVDFRPLRLEDIDPPALRRALDDSGIKWKVIVISACYSGGFIGPLKDDHTLIITASSAAKPSFGCGNDSDATYLAKALFDEELRRTHSFEVAFERARRTIERRERSGNHDASEPQLHAGAAIREKLAEVERRLAALRIP